MLERTLKGPVGHFKELGPYRALLSEILSLRVGGQMDRSCECLPCAAVCCATVWREPGSCMNPSRCSIGHTRAHISLNRILRAPQGPHMGPYLGPYLAALFCSVGCPILHCRLTYFPFVGEVLNQNCAFWRLDRLEMTLVALLYPRTWSSCVWAPWGPVGPLTHRAIENPTGPENHLWGPIYKAL